MYSTYSSVIELVPLLDNIDKTTVNSFIYKAGSIINSTINNFYVTPIQKKNNCNGKISITKDTSVIVGYGTDFSEIREFSFLFLPKKNKTVRVIFVENDNVAILDEKVCMPYLNQEYFILPDWIVTATEFVAVNLLLNREFSRKGYNQEGIQKYKDDYSRQSRMYLDNIRQGVYYDNDLVPISADFNLGRFTYYDNNVLNELSSNIELEMKRYYD